MASQPATAGQAENKAPALRAVDISDNVGVLQFTTTLRRLWHLDPWAPAIRTRVEHERQLHERSHASTGGGGGDHDHDHEQCTDAEHQLSPEEYQVQKAFPMLFKFAASSVTQAMAAAAEVENNEQHPLDPARHYLDDSLWKSDHEVRQLLFNPLTTDDDERDQLVSPFRMQVYGVYSHVFWDVFGMLDANKLPGEKFTPPATTTAMLLEADDEDEDEDGLVGIQHQVETDTYIYPAWMAYGVELTVTVEQGGNGEEIPPVVFGPEGHTCTHVLWVKAGTEITVTPRAVDRGADTKGVLAVVALGICNPEGGEDEEAQ